MGCVMPEPLNVHRLNESIGKMVKEKKKESERWKDAQRQLLLDKFGVDRVVIVSKFNPDDQGKE